MNKEEIISTFENINSQVHVLNPEAIRIIIEKVETLLKNHKTTCLDFREWGIETDGNEGSYAVAYDKYGPCGGGSIIGITLCTNRNGEKMFTVEVSCEFDDVTVSSSSLRLSELVDLIKILDDLEEDLNGGDNGKPEWEIDEDGTVTYIDDEND